jgi:hypothetical protein
MEHIARPEEKANQGGQGALLRFHEEGGEGGHCSGPRLWLRPALHAAGLGLELAFGDLLNLELAPTGRVFAPPSHGRLSDAQCPS